MLKSIPIGHLRPNPFRRLDEYPIQREKVDALKESIEATGFWGTVVARPAKAFYEIAFGHHRMIALQEVYGPDQSAEIIVRDLTNEQMLQMMARENMEEWGTSAWVELETVRAAIEGYASGAIDLPHLPKKTPEINIRYANKSACSHPYTKALIAEVLGWTSPNHDGSTVRPDFKCNLAFDALDLIDAGLMDEASMRNRTRAQAQVLINEVKAIKKRHEEQARAEREAAKTANRRAAEAKQEPERQRREQEARVHTEQATRAEKKATTQARQFVKDAAKKFDQGSGVRDVRKSALDYKPTPDVIPEINDVDDFAMTLVKKLARVANDDAIAKDFDFLAGLNLVDLSAEVEAELIDELGALVGRLEGFRTALTTRAAKARRRDHKVPRGGTGENGHALVGPEA